MWAPDSFKLFLSHTSKYRELAHALKSALLPEGISLFVAHDDIEPTAEWRDQLEAALGSMDALAALLTYDFHTSNWTDQEIGFGLGVGCLVVPLKLDAVPYGFFGRYQAMSISGESFAESAREVRCLLSKNELTSAEMALALSNRIARSKSAQKIADLAVSLAECPIVPKEVTAQLKRAYRSNSALRHSSETRDLVGTVIAGQELSVCHRSSVAKPRR